MKRLNQIHYTNGDKIVMFLVAKRNEIYYIKSLCPEIHIYELYHQFNIANRKELGSYFLDNPIHCNHRANKLIADYLFDILYEKEPYKPANIPKIHLKEETQEAFFEENKELEEYIKSLRSCCRFVKDAGAIVMNCNPFTRGHRYLVEYASCRVEQLFLFVVEENKSYFTFEERYEMVKRGVADLENVVVFPSGKFILSAQTFPEYFTKEEEKDIIVDTSLDIELFGQRIAPALNIKYRFVGEEPLDPITNQYNIEMKRILPQHGIKLIEIPRLKLENTVVSATKVRLAIENKDWVTVEKYVPDTTLEYLKRQAEKNLN